MGCTSCGTSGGCSTGGCNSNNGCSTGGCNKMNVFDWLGNMEDAILPSERMNIVEIRFKGGRKEYFKNSANLELTTGDPVVVEVPNGHHLGFVSLQGELVRLQMKKKGVADDENIKAIYRIANEKDLERYELSKMREMGTLYRTRQIAMDLKLEMKMSDVEYQADNTKATFYYSADDRVDFRELIKLLASEFKIRVEMKQISLRQEASRLGGIGVCGRELCCSTWLTDFKNVSTAAARYQNLSLNPAKLSGQCSRLKCCLNYELETYMEALKDIPSIEAPLMTEKGPVFLQKTDIFRRIMWFSFQGETAWYPLSIDQVLKVVELNEKGIKPETLDPEDFVEQKVPQELRPINDDLAKLDKKYSASKSKKKKKKPGNGGSTFGASSSSIAPSQGTSVVPQRQQAVQPNRPNQGIRPTENQQGKVQGNNQGNSQGNPNKGQKPQNTINQKPQQNSPKPQQPSQNPKPPIQGSGNIQPRTRENIQPENPPKKQDGNNNSNNTSGGFSPRTPVKPNN